MENKIPVEKNKEYIVEIIDNGFEGEGIAKIEGYTIFVPGAIKKEKCKILIVKVTSSHAFGKIIEIIEKASLRKDKQILVKAAKVLNQSHDQYVSTSEDIEYNTYFCNRIALRELVDEIPLELVNQEIMNVRKSCEESQNYVSDMTSQAHQQENKDIEVACKTLERLKK